MLCDAANARAVAKGLNEFYKEGKDKLPPLVIDPVCVSTSGHTLLEPDAIGVIVQELFPLARLITPNKQEAELLLARMLGNERKEIGTVEDAIQAAANLGKLSSCDVLLKGGHLTVLSSELRSFISLREAGGKASDVVWPGVEQNMEILQTKASKLDAPLVIDVLFEHQSEKTTILARYRIESTSTHGTGCTLSAAIACYLARGNSGLWCS